MLTCKECSRFRWDCPEDEGMICHVKNQEEKIRKDVAKEILQKLHGWEVLFGSDNPVDEMIEELVEEYGVEIE